MQEEVSVPVVFVAVQYYDSVEDLTLWILGFSSRSSLIAAAAGEENRARWVLKPAAFPQVTRLRCRVHWLQASPSSEVLPDRSSYRLSYNIFGFYDFHVQLFIKMIKPFIHGPFCAFNWCGRLWTGPMGPQTAWGLQLSYVEINQLHRQCEIN